MQRLSLLLFGLMVSAIALAAPPAGRTPVRVEASHLPNAYRVTDQVISGGLPEGEIAFEELARLGVKTVISVDGMTPDVETARRHGLRYVHLPHGYDRVPVDRGKELAKAVAELPGPVYIHCHHGKHRSPAAAAVACIEAGLLDPQDALAVLATAGTNPNYAGLYDSVRQARPLPPEELKSLKVTFVERSKVPPVAAVMVELEHAFDLVKTQADSRSPDRPRAKEAALLLREHYRELQRMDEVRKKPRAFQESLASGERIASSLQTELEQDTINGQAVAARIKTLTTNCADCHRDFRDNPK
jgi:protein tyrosine phosphatase (PTP) superfamily phosphohydrolase (DUF442 family)